MEPEFGDYFYSAYFTGSATMDNKGPPLRTVVRLNNIECINSIVIFTNVFEELTFHMA